MALVTSGTKFCFIECDSQNCNKKIENVGEKPLRDIAELCGWKHKGNRWACPDCAEQLDNRPGFKKKQRSFGAELKA